MPYGPPSRATTFSRETDLSHVCHMEINCNNGISRHCLEVDNPSWDQIIFLLLSEKASMIKEDKLPDTGQPGAGTGKYDETFQLLED